MGGEMISLILPYWDRQEAADKAIRLLAETYSGLDLEVVVVDDGNAVPFVAPETDLNLKIVRLPVKANPCSPVTAWNAGVAAASGEIIILSCVEVLHTVPVIPDMVENLREIGPLGYVHASAWCPDQNKWHVHSTVKVPTCPPGTALHFCSAMFKTLYQAAGGMDEEYRPGAGYEDNDFVYRLLSVGARFVVRDDLVVIHPKSGAQIHWQSEDLRRNRDLYFSKWPQARNTPITVICLKAGTAYGPEYVNILFDMVRRNLIEGYPGRFVCITDDTSGLNEGIETLPLPADLPKWWGKLYMFKNGLFEDGERCLFFDLDTLIVGPIDALAGYRGDFATLRDFYFPQQVGPAVIAWKAGGVASTIWQEWEAQGRPWNEMGDLWWINSLDQGRFAHDCYKLQDVFPGKFVSYKASCHPYPPKGTAVVCFHGQPKPDNCGAEWVADTWRINGGGFAELSAIANTQRNITDKNIKAACERNLPWLQIKPVHDKQAVIVSGGPSIDRTIEEIEWRRSLGQAVIAVNGSAKWLNDRGIIPDIHVVIDARPENSRFVTESVACCRFLASQCDPSVFNASTSTVLFHMNTEGISSLIPKDREANLISSGTTAGLAAMAVAYTQGYRALHLHGFDSSYEGKHHAYLQPENDGDIPLDVAVNGQKFKAAPWMVKQAQQFQELALALAEDGVIITVAGDGLLPTIAHCMAAPEGEPCH